MSAPPVLRIEGLTKHYLARDGGGVTRAVDGVSLEIMAGETLALVGESGCGKSTTARCALRLIAPSGGRVMFEGVDVLALAPAELRRMRRRFQFVFQDPFASLNPRMCMGAILEEPLLVHRMGDRARREARVAELLVMVGLGPDHARRFAHELSGGQRQRVGIARALATSPSLVICDEPVSALDVSVQAQVLNLLSDLKRALGLSYLFITHDLGVVRRVADRVAVMLHGRIVEIATVGSLFGQPAHPYTARLLDATPVLDPARRQAAHDPGAEAPAPAFRPAGPEGCSYTGRCAVAIARCAREAPSLRAIAEGHLVACHRGGELPLPAPFEDAALSSVAQRRLALLDRLADAASSSCNEGASHVD